MSAKENPGGKAEGFKESSCSAISEQFHPSSPKASEKPAQGQQKEPRAGTQLATVLEPLRCRSGQFVGVDEIMRHARCAATHSAISTLRRRYGFQIENRMRRSKEGVLLSDYKLEEEES